MRSQLAGGQLSSGEALRLSAQDKQLRGGRATDLPETLLQLATAAHDPVVVGMPADPVGIRAAQLDETAEALEISPATVKRGWSLARAWLYRELQTASI